MSKLVNVSEAVSIAIHSLAVIARVEGYMNGVEISEITGYSRNHTAKVLQTLARHRILESERGPKGGFKLTTDPKLISFMSIYQIVEGEYQVNGQCKHQKDQCLFKECVFGAITVKLATEFEEYLLNKTIGDLI